MIDVRSASYYAEHMPTPMRMVRYAAALLSPWRPVFRTTAQDSGLRFWVQPRDAVGRHIAKYGRYEAALTHWIRKHLSSTPPGLFVDVGANIGWHTVHAAQFPNVTKLIAFEPDAENAEILRLNLRDNDIGNAEVVVSAVGSTVGIARLFRYKASNHGRHSLVNDYGFGAEAVPVIDLDTALGRGDLADKPISLIKIDVEGFEPKVISGANRTLDRTVAIVAEFSPDLSPPRELTEMVRQLSRVGFLPHKLLKSGEVIQIGRQELLKTSEQIDIVWLRSLDA